jgi:hypothetical protein
MTLVEMLEEQKVHFNRRAKEMLDDRKREIERLEKGFQLVPMLDAAGLLDHARWSHGYFLSISLGAKPSGKRARYDFTRKLTALRQIFGCPLKIRYKSLHDPKKRLIRVHLNPDDEFWQHFDIEYIDKLPRNGRCKVVKRRCRPDYDLTCEVAGSR